MSLTKYKGYRKKYLHEGKRISVFEEGIRHKDECKDECVRSFIGWEKIKQGGKDGTS